MDIFLLYNMWHPSLKSTQSSPSCVCDEVSSLNNMCVGGLVGSLIHWWTMTKLLKYFCT